MLGEGAEGAEGDDDQEEEEEEVTLHTAASDGESLRRKAPQGVCATCNGLL